VKIRLGGCHHTELELRLVATSPRHLSHRQSPVQTHACHLSSTFHYFCHHVSRIFQLQGSNNERDLARALFTVHGRSLVSSEICTHRNDPTRARAPLHRTLPHSAAHLSSPRLPILRRIAWSVVPRCCDVPEAKHLSRSRGRQLLMRRAVWPAQTRRSDVVDIQCFI
jgi:hypothetical protein